MKSTTHCGRKIRHAVEVRHETFRTPDFVALAGEHGIAIVIAGSDYPQIADMAAEFVYGASWGRVRARRSAIRKRHSTYGLIARGFGRRAVCPRNLKP
jgi:uncharacterized protein YecE (DUF72 family)